MRRRDPRRTRQHRGGRRALRPTLALAAATAALSRRGGLPACRRRWARTEPELATGVIVSLLAGAAALVQPRAGRARDDGRIGDRAGLATGLVLTAAGSAAVLIPGIGGLLTAAIARIGVGVGLITPIGFAQLAATTPTGRLGQTMGSAEVGPRTRRRRRPAARRRSRRRHHAHPRATVFRRNPHRHRRSRRRTPPTGTVSSQ